ncbi:hypothetical protein [uncultured Methanoregula sp.]|uniref:hypothetical protein n=1 Tax=uncultured Methanoregula sp. TaxID=1005933 RepID=UPI002AAC1D7D|nr:hypothetical protein [uncultured Methanoregula sp.]
MTGTLFEILMVIALGTFGGACFGLLIGYVARLQNPEWFLMSRREKYLNCTLVLVCSALCIAELAWYVLG